MPYVKRGAAGEVADTAAVVAETRATTAAGTVRRVRW